MIICFKQLGQDWEVCDWDERGKRSGRTRIFMVIEGRQECGIPGRGENSILDRGLQPSVSIELADFEHLSSFKHLLFLYHFRLKQVPCSSRFSYIHAASSSERRDGEFGRL